ncbi:metal-dependent hydrolase [Lipingzhangella sp. LS1_29]|uniref:Metal-dependent hydrolase n=1 Tax=Lipingzhangella rawalii TaxID=2055835 RepID=A0ABU2H2M7_9ACTN|nr:metal-dependent hydrolase [Lipingzhangella rawalii]MDS1269553.1 metal-dependent hydrolase [Lipingzhangella rawalii]
MMGHTHALSGAAGWMAAVPLVQDTELAGISIQLGPGEIVAGALVCAGSALLPDLDHRSATITQTYGIVTRTLSRVINWAFGGHRNGTHSLFFAALAGVGAGALALVNELAVQIFVFLMIGIALRGLGLGVPKNQTASEVINALVTAGIVLALYSAGVDYAWMGLAVAFGCLLHFLGDILTHMGCPLFWPINTYRVGNNIGFSTNGTVEQYLVTPLLTIAVILYSIYLFPWPDLLP